MLINKFIFTQILTETMQIKIIDVVGIRRFGIAHKQKIPRDKCDSKNTFSPSTVGFLKDFHHPRGNTPGRLTSDGTHFRGCSPR